MTFSEAIRAFFRNYSTFTTRASRSEYWWGYLFMQLVGLGLIAAKELFPEASISSLLLGFLLLGWLALTLLPWVGLHVRRLHDTGRSGWWVPIYLLPLAGPLLCIMWNVERSGPENQWGLPAGPTVADREAAPLKPEEAP
jgi:uncharacterized membrane protein YhaH (DUF805 family)